MTKPAILDIAGFARGSLAWLAAPMRQERASVCARLLDTIVKRKFSVIFGSVSTLIMAACAHIITGSWWPLLWVAIDLAILTVRLTLMFRYERLRKQGAEVSVHSLLVMGGVWSILFGLGCYACIATGSPALAVLAGLNVAGALGVITSRNAATPRYAILIMLAVSMPYVIGAVTSAEPGMFVVGIQIPIYIFGTIIVMIQNHSITARMIRAELDNRDLAVTDALTGLPNRIALQERLREMCVELCTPEASGAPPFAVLSMDLDGFKQINDSFGHATGDLLLRQVAERLRRTFREHDMVCRVGGDEFVILLPGTTEIEATHLARRSIEEISLPFDLGAGSRVRVGLSIGGAFAPVDGSEAEVLLNCSDQALYEAKRTGKGRYRPHIQQAG